MAKKALCVGINDYPYGDQNDLRGCVNDANDWAALLKDHFDFTDVKQLLDSEAKKSDVIAGLKQLLKGAKAGDVLVFTNASHGTYDADKSGDEPNYDEALCPYDTDSNLILDDDLRELFANLKKGVSLSVILDSCHSGSGTRVVIGPQIRRRFLSPQLRQGVVLSDSELRSAGKRKEKFPESKMKEILLSGCKSNQTSADALIEGGFHGAMTYHAIKIIKEANYRITYSELHARLLPMLEDANYDQEPQLEGKEANKDRQVFT